MASCLPMTLSLDGHDAMSKGPDGMVSGGLLGELPIVRGHCMVCIRHP